MTMFLKFYITKRALVLIVVFWILFKLITYYLLPYFIVPLVWLVLVLAFLVVGIIQVVKLIREHKKLSTLRVQKVIVFSLLFYLTLDRWLVDGVIEKIDWAIFYKQRTEIIEQVKKKELNPNVNWNGWICELPYEFPVVSHSGNDIGIYRNDKSKGITVTFWTYRNFFSAPSTCFVYSDNSDDMKEFERQIADDPEHNWKIKENWHRTFGE